MKNIILTLLLLTVVVTLTIQSPPPYTIVGKLHNEIKPQQKVHYCGVAFVRAWKIACMVKQRHNLIFKRNFKGIHPFVHLKANPRLVDDTCHQYTEGIYSEIRKEH